jgi:hypothetical protein
MLYRDNIAEQSSIPVLARAQRSLFIPESNTPELDHGGRCLVRLATLTIQAQCRWLSGGARCQRHGLACRAGLGSRDDNCTLSQFCGVPACGLRPAWWLLILD